MKYSTPTVIFISALLLIHLPVNGQQTGKVTSLLHADSLSRTTTGAILDSVKYYIKLPPVDTVHEAPMPRYKPDDVEFVSVDAQPVPVKQVPATYPDEARASKLAGTVWVKCLVGKEGKVTKAVVARSDAAIFNKAAITAARQWIFSPARLKGKPVAVWAVMPFRFTLEK
jgi:TonB family protein